MAYKNHENYPPLNAKKFTPARDLILVQWEDKKGTLLDGRLITPETHKKMHYTGIVIAVGPWVDSEIGVGDRIIFDQFSNFEKFFDEKFGRLALIEEGRQGACFAVIPKRLETRDFKVTDILISNREIDYEYA